MAGKGRGEEPLEFTDDEIEAAEQLTLADTDERLPWLESDDDDDEPSFDTGRLIGFAAVGLLALVLILGAVWFVTRDAVDEQLVADGGVIEAPEGPYKARPADPGGRPVEGTGDTSFAVAEGRTVEGRVAGSGDAPTPVPSPSIDRAQGAAPAAAATPAASGGVGVQVGAYSTKAAAETGWTQLSGRIEALQGRSHRVLQGTADSGTIFRLQAVAGSAAEADTLCRAIRSQGGDCQVKR